MAIVKAALLAFVICHVYGAEVTLPNIQKGEPLFASYLYQAIGDNLPGNFVVSPLSAYLSTAMLAYGTKGSTRNDFSQVLRMTEDLESMKSEFQTLLDHLNGTDDVNFNLANQAYFDDSLKVEEDYKNLLEKFFRSRVVDVDFSDLETVATLANNWTANKTNNMIKTILNAEEIDPLTVMILLNSVYFNGRWAHGFKKESIKAPFHSNLKTTKTASFMIQKSMFRLAESDELDAVLIELPYTNKDLRMVVICPNEIDGLAKIEKNLDSIDINNHIKKHARKERVYLRIPKFSVESSHDLLSILENMGINLQNGDFSGISKDLLGVDQVIQKTVIKMDEHGTKAAAVTSNTLTLRAGFTDVLNIDRPFYFMIDYLGIVLFQGRVADPQM